MKNLLLLCPLVLLFFSCAEETINQTSCTTPATVRDLTGLDVCGWVFELADGTRLEPYWEWGFCGTPPLPEGMEEDPLYSFEYVDGKTVFIDYKVVEMASVCMVGPTVKITCISPRYQSTKE